MCTDKAGPSPKRVKPSLEAPNKLKKASLSNKAPNYKKRKTMEPQFKRIWGKEKERKKITKPISFFLKLPITLFVCFIFLLSSLAPQ
jgi:hypothetical protein